MDFNHRPIASLFAIFLAWKSVLLLLALSSPGRAYDTSTSLLFANADTSSPNSGGLGSLVTDRLTRWDAIYFVKVAERGYLFEQEWAFGWGWTGLISLATNGLFGHKGGIQVDSLVGTLIAHLSHGLSVFVLYYLTVSTFTSLVTPQVAKKLSYISACLHIFSPAGLFLSAPFTESTFALLSVSGYYFFIHSQDGKESSIVKKDACLVLAGAIFGLSVTIRSNGILNGILFLEEAVRALLSFRIHRLLAAGLGGALVGIGFLLPQFLAYQQFCNNTDDIKREWCTRTIPSIYTFVQSHYWDVGFLRYWTLSNIPLFLLATPMLTILAVSSAWAIQIDQIRSGSSETLANTKSQPERGDGSRNSNKHLARTVKIMAVIQGILGLATLLNAHVQIITRMATAYPVWHWWLASRILKSASSDEKKSSEWIVKWMVMYAVIQGGLFVSFLPPA